MEGKRDRVYLSYDIVGSQDTAANGEKPPIICLHGMTSAKEAWQNVVRPIAEATSRKVYAFDARNHGDSGWSDLMDYEVMKEDLLQFMDCIHSKKAILIGHSMGGKTAMFFATTWPERVEKLIVEDMSPHSVSVHLRDLAMKYVDRLRDAVKSIPSDLKDLQEAKNFVYGFMNRNTQQDHDSSMNDENEASSLPLTQDESGQFKWKTNLKAAQDYLMNRPESTNVTGTYSGPTLILYGTKSLYKVSADRDYIKRVFPAAQLRAIEGATHQVHQEQADVFVKEVVDFINES